MRRQKRSMDARMSSADLVQRSGFGSAFCWARKALMAGVVCLTLAQLPSTAGLGNQLLRVGAPVAIGGAAYCSLYWLLGGRELGMLLRGRIVD